MPTIQANLSLNNLSLHYGEEAGRVSICRDVSFLVRPGEILGIFGPNGCGKSTIMKTIAGTMEPDSGAVRFPFVRPNGSGSIALVPQDYRDSFFPWANLLNNIRMAIVSSDISWKTARHLAESARDDLGIPLDLTLRPHECSGGMIQIGALIRAFASNHPLLLADEPFSALDIEVVRRVRVNFRNTIKQRNLIAVVVLHSLQDIVEVCDRVLVIPGRPFSTSESNDCHQARIIENRRIKATETSSATQSFESIAEAFLAAEGA